MIPMLTEQKIIVFLSLASTLNFTETANQLFVTQQAVSKHISQLEKELGIPLFVRSTHNVKLTPAGERCQTFFQKQMEDYTVFIESERENERKLSKSLRIGYNDWLDLGKAVSTARMRFHEQYPNITHIPERQPPDLLQAKLRGGELDIILVLRRFLRVESGLRIVPLAKFPMSILISRSLAESPGSTSIKELSKLPLIINSFSGETFQETAMRARNEMALFGLQNEKIVPVPNRDSVYTAVETGEGIAIACSFIQVPESITKIPTDMTDTLVCICTENNSRRLVDRYMGILKTAFAEQDSN